MTKAELIERVAKEEGVTKAGPRKLSMPLLIMLQRL